MWWSVSSAVRTVENVLGIEFANIPGELAVYTPLAYFQACQRGATNEEYHQILLENASR